jgi:hypothetical protein
MKSKAISRIIDRINSTKNFDATLFGKQSEKITNGIFKYLPNEEEISQLTVFYDGNNQLTEIGFLTKPEPLKLSELTDVYGAPKLFYNFRDDFTRFEYYPAMNDRIEKIYCDLEHEWFFDGSKLIEKHLNEGTERPDVDLEGFCVKVK